MSPTLNRGASIDLNFQYSGTRPYLYYTRLNAYAAAGFLNHRDVVRWKLSVSRAAAAAPQ